MKQISCFQELLILFWKLIDENKEFLSYILRAGDINELVVPMLYFMYEGTIVPLTCTIVVPPTSLCST
jgi:hypothetical protein